MSNMTWVSYSSFTFAEMFTKNKLHDPYTLPNYQYVRLTLGNGNTLGTALERGKVKLLRNSAHGHSLYIAHVFLHPLMGHIFYYQGRPINILNLHNEKSKINSIAGIISVPMMQMD